MTRAGVVKVGAEIGFSANCPKNNFRPAAGAEKCVSLQMMCRIKTYLVLLVAVILAACNGIEPPYTGTFDQVVIYYGMGYNNLSGNLKQNLVDLQEDVLPGLHREKAIVAFIHTPAIPGDYSTPNAPVLIRFYRDRNGKSAADTLKVYDDMTVSASPESIRRVLEDVRQTFPAEHYGLLISSHGSGWLPAGYTKNSERAGARAIGNQYANSGSTRWVEVKDLATAIPMHLDYMILDVCLAGCIEVAWELKDICDRLVVSPTEILTMGMGYSWLSWDMFAGAKPDLETYCREYYDYYNGQEGSYRSGTISLVDCARLQPLADAFRFIIEAHRDALVYNTLTTRVQRYFYSSTPLTFFYDLRDLATQIGASPDELSRLDAALAEAVPVHYETPSFFDLSLDRCCGLSVYLPDPTRPSLNAYYRTLGWNQAVGLVK